MPNGNGDDPNSIDAPDIEDSTTQAPLPLNSSFGAPAAPAPPAQKPSYFKSIIGALGLALAQGAKAGLTAPRNAQGPAVAAQTALNAPQAEFEQKMANKKAVTSAQLDDLNVAMTQLKIHQLTMITSKMDEDAQDAVYNTGREALQTLMDKGKAEVLATGDYAAVTQLFTQKQKDARASGQGLLPIQVLPSVGSTAKNPQYSLVMVGKDKLTADWDDKWGADDLGVSADDFKAAGLTTMKFHAGMGMEQQKALQLYASQHLQWATKSQQLLAKWNQTKATEAGKDKRNQATIDMRWGIAKLNAEKDKTVAMIRSASQTDNKELLQALNERKAHIDKLAGLEQQSKGVTGWIDLGGRVQSAIRRENDAIKQTDQRISALSTRKAAGQAVSDMNKPALVPKGTIATLPIARQYLQKAGGDTAKARQMMVDDGYTIPPRQPKAQ